MNGILAASIPVFGLLACLFLGFILLSSEARSGERFAYVFFGVGVAWLIASGMVLWPKVSHAGAAPAIYAAAQPALTRNAVPAPQRQAHQAQWPRQYAYAYGYPYRQPSHPAYGYHPYGYWR